MMCLHGLPPRMDRSGMDEPVSMYVPARHAADTLPACIASIRAQTRPPDELFILADPRSSDRTLAVARETGVGVIEQQGLSLGAARNEAIQHASHRWLASCDSDVVLEPDWLEKLLPRRREQVAGIQGRTNERILTPADAWRALHMPHHWGEYPLRNPFMLVSEVLFDRHALLAVGGYRDDLNYYEDSDLCQRLRDAGFALFYEPAAVATHYRSDDTLSLLNLRWKYSEYRQKQHMDRYAGLLRKIAVNREYALTTLARCLSHDRDELTYLSFLLFFHHMVLDLRSFHSRRPLLSTEMQEACEHGLARVALRTLTAHDEELSHLDDIGRAVDSFCQEIPSDLWPVVLASGHHVRGQSARDTFPRWLRPAREAVDHALGDLPVETVVNDAFLADVHGLWPDAGPLIPLTVCSADERDLLANAPAHGDTPIGLAAHVESLAAPREIFDVADSVTNGVPRLRRLVLCYQPPARFVPGVDIPSAAELSSLASSCGWSIVKFDTLVGRIRLMLTRD